MEKFKISKRTLIISGISIVILLAVFFIGFGSGQSSASISLNGQKTKAVQLQNEIKKLNVKWYDQNQNLKDAQDQFNQFKSEHQAEFALAGKKDQLTAQVTETQANLDALKQQVSGTQGKLDVLKNQVAQASGQLTKAQGAPKTLQPGTYIVGKDVPEGRYTVTPVGDGSNFFVHDSSGASVVNTILGSNGVPSYTFNTVADDQIQTEAVVTLTPMN
ncbi:hypothetical protein OYT88_11980 [Sporolactobacillus sp. CQH2019]|uniref:hypothetical protein n=1 Tax=Sporolactobacillus sp. CQH2019 TaxID=3023512 RepID=UPI002368C074|nr:hypothetical protein [Sporolactobacillus sp. CQH2019]MDD9149273.1 hypothetical protein [Sporolactobacillus sp. CQH2019]